MVKEMLLVDPIPIRNLTRNRAELDRVVIQACKQGNRQALVQFVRHYEKRVFAYLSRSLGWQFCIEDLAQEVFLRAYPALARFDVDGSAQLSTWLLTIAHRVAVDARRRRAHEGCHASFSDDYPGPSKSPERILDQEQVVAMVSRAAESLPVDQREVFVLAEFHELSTIEISTVVGASEATVKTRLFRAKAKLRLMLGACLKEFP
jgi:RNA polymerase sigma-70 factor, ECF subfamily